MVVDALAVCGFGFVVLSRSRFVWLRSQHVGCARRSLALRGFRHLVVLLCGVGRDRFGHRFVVVGHDDVFGSFLHIGEMLIDGREVDPVVDGNGFELRERSVHQLTHGAIGSERNLVAPLDDNGLARVHIHALARSHGHHLECAQSLDLYLSVGLDALGEHVEHLLHKLLCRFSLQSILVDQRQREFLKSYLAHGWEC